MTEQKCRGSIHVQFFSGSSASMAARSGTRLNRQAAPSQKVVRFLTVFCRTAPAPGCRLPPPGGRPGPPSGKPLRIPVEGRHSCNLHHNRKKGEGQREKRDGFQACKFAFSGHTCLRMKQGLFILVCGLLAAGLTGCDDSSERRARYAEKSPLRALWKGRLTLPKSPPSFKT